MTQVASHSNKIGFSAAQIEQFHRDGFVVARSLVDTEEVAELRALISDHEQLQIEPAEFEADVRYPGAPKNREAPGGNTPRRLLQAYRRHDRLRRWATDPGLVLCLRQLFGQRSLRLSQSHHNCIMTKCPAYSSDTSWHQDVRYWSFSDRNLINAWLALGEEFAANGGLRVIAGSHRWEGLSDSGRLDEALFLRPDHPRNVAAIARAVQIDLRPGDVLFFHAAVFHSASRNHTDDKKYSVVYTYHQADNKPVPNTKSAKYPSITID